MAMAYGSFWYYFIAADACRGVNSTNFRVCVLNGYMYLLLARLSGNGDIFTRYSLSLFSINSSELIEMKRKIVVDAVTCIGRSRFIIIKMENAIKLNANDGNKRMSVYVRREGESERESQVENDRIIWTISYFVVYLPQNIIVIFFHVLSPLFFFFVVVCPAACDWLLSVVWMDMNIRWRVQQFVLCCTSTFEYYISTVIWSMVCGLVD